MMFALHKPQLITIAMEHLVQLEFYSLVIIMYGVQCVLQISLSKILMSSVIGWAIVVNSINIYIYIYIIMYIYYRILIHFEFYPSTYPSITQSSCYHMNVFCINNYMYFKVTDNFFIIIDGSIISSIHGGGSNETGQYLTISCPDLFYSIYKHDNYYAFDLCSIEETSLCPAEEKSIYLYCYNG